MWNNKVKKYQKSIIIIFKKYWQYIKIVVISLIEGGRKMIHIKIDEHLKQELESEAKLKGLSLNAYIRMLLIERKK